MLFLNITTDNITMTKKPHFLSILICFFFLMTVAGVRAKTPCPDLRSWHFVKELVYMRKYTEHHCDMMVVNQSPISVWGLLIRLPARNPFIEPKIGFSYWPSRYEMEDITWKPVYESADFMIEELLNNAVFVEVQDSGEAKSCVYQSNYLGVGVVMHAQTFDEDLDEKEAVADDEED